MHFMSILVGRNKKTPKFGQKMPEKRGAIVF
jgi:hypothetical protein